jgi:hypothetical protein
MCKLRISLDVILDGSINKIFLDWAKWSSFSDLAEWSTLSLFLSPAAMFFPAHGMFSKKVPEKFELGVHMNNSSVMGSTL